MSPIEAFCTVRQSFLLQMLITWAKLAPWETLVSSAKPSKHVIPVNIHSCTRNLRNIVYKLLRHLIPYSSWANKAVRQKMYTSICAKTMLATSHFLWNLLVPNHFSVTTTCIASLPTTPVQWDGPNHPMEGAESSNGRGRIIQWKGPNHPNRGRVHRGRIHKGPNCPVTLLSLNFHHLQWSYVNFAKSNKFNPTTLNWKS